MVARDALLRRGRVRALIASECHARAKLDSMAKYLGDLQVLYHRLHMTEPTVEELVVAVLLRSLPRDANYATFVSNLLQFSKDSKLTVQDIVDQGMLFDSAETVRLGPAVTALSVDAMKMPPFTAEERAAYNKRTAERKKKKGDSKGDKDADTADKKPDAAKNSKPKPRTARSRTPSPAPGYRYIRASQSRLQR